MKHSFWQLALGQIHAVRCALCTLGVTTINAPRLAAKQNGGKQEDHHQQKAEQLRASCVKIKLRQGGLTKEAKQIEGKVDDGRRYQ